MRFLMPLTTVLALALTGCGAAVDATTPTTGAGVTAPTDDATDDADDPEAPTDDADDTDSTDSTDSTDDDTDAAEPTDASDDVAASGDCSAAGLADQVMAGAAPDQARATAGFLLDAAVRCDEQLLHTAATESDTVFMFGSTSVDELLALPEDGGQDPAPWEALARLLAGTTPVVDGDLVTWPAAFAEDADDAAWQELVTSGLYDQATVDELRAAPDGYLGWRIGIHADGSWTFMAAGD